MAMTSTGGVSTPPISLRARNLLLSGLIFVVGVLLTLVVLPPLVDAPDTAIRAELDTLQAFAEALVASSSTCDSMVGTPIRADHIRLLALYCWPM